MSPFTDEYDIYFNNKLYFGVTTNTYDWFQIKMCTFSMRTLILGHHEMVTQMYQPIFKLFLKLNRPVHNLLFELCNSLF